MRAIASLTIVLAGLAVPLAFAAYEHDNVLSPRGQMDGGIAAEDVACKEDMQLMIRGNGDAICVYEQTVQRLTDEGIAVTSGMPDDGAAYKMMEDAVLSASSALALYDIHGQDAFEKITATNATDHAYPWVITADTAVEIADGSILDRRGMKVWSDIELRAALSNIKGIIERGDDAWITYVFLNPATGADQAKMSWIVQRDGYIFGSGFYIDGKEAKPIISDWSIKMAISTYDHLGADEAFTLITAMESDKTGYPFVVDMDGVIVAHGANPSSVGEQSPISTLDEWEGIVADLADTKSITAVYEFADPVTGANEPKQTMLVLHDGYIFGSSF